MRVTDTETGIVMESTNEHTVSQWVLHPEKYAEIKEASAPPKAKGAKADESKGD